MTDGDMPVDTEWLARNARHVGTEDWEETKDTERRSRAAKNHEDVLIAPEEGLGRWQVKFHDGDPHQVLLVKSQEEYAGACDCEGFTRGGHTCAHLISVRIGEVTDRTNVPESHDYVTELSREDAVPADTSEGGGGADADTSSESTDTTPDTTNDNQAPAPVEEPTQAPDTPSRDDAFATEMPDVDPKYQMTMNGETYIRKAGYARLLKQIEARPDVTRDVRAKDTDYERAEVTATIVDNQTGTVLGEAIGTAGPPDREDMADADMHLDELAETRAWTRAASIATGEGLTAFAELPENAEEVVE